MRPAFARREVLAVVAVLALVLLAMAPFYGPHRDELYFASAGDRLAWGYPDQPSFTPLVARLTTGLADLLSLGTTGRLVLLRLPSIAAVGLLVVLAAAYARLLGGARGAQVLTAVTVAFSVVTMTVGHRLSTATFDTLVWTALLLVVSTALVDDRPRLWLLAGVLGGVGLHNKHAVVFVLLGVLVGVAAVRQTRGALRTPWPWLGGLVALALWLPNLAWQAAHDWPVRELSADIAEEYGGVAGRVGLVGEALLMFSPVVALVWLLGLVQLLRRPEWVRLRPVAVCFLTLLAVFLVTGGKGYYLAGAVPPLVAAGCTDLAGRWPGRRLVAAGVVLPLSALVAWPALVPVLPPRAFAASFYPAINDDQPETIGWPEHVRTVRRVLSGLPDGAVVLTANYGEAGALEWYGVDAPVHSGHNGWSDWGPPKDGSAPVVVVGVEDPSTLFEGCRAGPVLDNDVGIDNEERGRRVWVCSGPRGTWTQRWPDLVHYDA